MRLKEFLVGTLCRKNELASYLYFHVSKILPIQNTDREYGVVRFFMIWRTSEAVNQITMGLLLLQLLNYMDKMETGSIRFDTELVGTVLNYIEEHYKSGSLTELAEMMKYDVYWLSREIKKRPERRTKNCFRTSG